MNRVSHIIILKETECFRLYITNNTPIPPIPYIITLLPTSNEY